MWIKNLYINDFGCYRQEHIEGFDSGLNVIAGPQRAGKSTFMQVVRHLGYALPNDSDVPPPNDPETGYDVDAEIVTADGEGRLRRTGSGEPELTGLETGRRELYANLSGFRYRLIFTISLDELRRKPPLARGEDELELQAALIGGGWADIVQLPRLRDNFAKDAEDIAGTGGRFSYELSTPENLLDEGIELREEARQQLEEYKNSCQRADELETQISKLEEENDELQLKVDRLTLLEDNYETYEEYLELQGNLDESAREILSEYPPQGRQQAEDHLEQFEEKIEDYRRLKKKWGQLVGAEKAAEVRQLLLANRSRLEEYNNQLSGWLEKQSQLTKTAREIEAKEEQLEAELGKISSDWRGNPEKLEEVNTDLVDRDELKRLARDLSGKKDRLEEKETQAEQLETEVENLGERLPEAEPGYGTELATAVGFAVFLAGLGASLANFPLLGLLCSLAGALATAFFGYRTYVKRNEAQETKELAIRLRQKESELESQRGIIAELRSKIEEREAEFSELRARLGLPEGISPDTTSDFYDRVVKLKQDYRELSENREEYEQERENFRRRLREAAELLAGFPGLDVPDDPLTEFDQFIQLLEDQLDRLDLLADLTSAEQEWQDYRNKVLNLLQSGPGQVEVEKLRTEPEQLRQQLQEFAQLGERYEELNGQQQRLKETESSLNTFLNQEVAEEALCPLASDSGVDDWKRAAFDSLFEEFASRDRVETERRDVAQELEVKQVRLEELKEELRKLEDKIDELATDEKLRKANEKIHSARSRVKPKLEEYAVNRLAENLLDTLYHRYVEKTRSGLLSEASELFSQITGDDYRRVQPFSEDPGRADFVAELDDGTEQRTAELSRGTREQLFLSVRLARINQIDPSLPVILDDSAVNFDPSHRRRTSRVIDELAGRNQVFVLTSHPELLEFIDSTSTDPTYWYIDTNHNFSPPRETPESLIANLKEQ